MVDRLESHNFDSVRVLQWRNRKLDFGSLNRLYDSLREMPREARLARARTADDVAALEAVMADRELAAIASTPVAVTKLWDVCQVPDYRKISGQSHNELIATLFKFVTQGPCRIPEDWFTKQVALADRTDGDIDTLATRISHIRTWTFVANRPDWLQDPVHWQQRTRAIEDSLSDALHERLTQRFVDRRTSALMKGMRDKDELNADIAEDGAITVENHFVGRLKGFRFTLDAAADGIHGKATRQAATQVLTRELGMRTRRVVAAQNDAFKLTRDGRIVWRDDDLAQLEAGEDPLQPTITLLADENLSEADREKVTARLQTWIKDIIADKLKPLADMSAATDLQGLARGIAFRLKENFGVLKRETVADEINTLDQTARADLRKYGLRFGAFNIFFPTMLKPAAADLAATLWLLKNPVPPAADGKTVQPLLPRPGLTSAATNIETPEALYRAYGFHVSGPRAVRLDILERLADLIRPLLAFRTKPDITDAPPKGATGDGGFRATDDMMSILGCSADELGQVLQSLGFRLDRRPVVVPKPEVHADAAEPTSEITVAAPPSEADAEPAAEITAAGDAAPVVEAAQAEVVAVASEPVEQKFEDIWRPKRHQRPERPKGQDNRRNERGRDRRPNASAATPPDAGVVATVTQADGAPSKLDERPRHDRGPRQPRPEQRDARPEGKREGRGPDRGSDRGQDRGRPGGKPNFGRDQGRDKGRREEPRRQPEVISAAPPKRTGTDPDSPFAALAALKASLDKRG